MAIIRATKLLAQALGVRLAPTALPPATKLGEWYGNVMPTSIGTLVILMNAPTRLAVLSHCLSPDSLAVDLPKRLTRILEFLGVSSPMVAHEVDGFGAVTFAKTTDRRFIGSLKQVCLMVAAHDENRDLRKTPDLVTLENYLSGMIHSQMAEFSPDRAVRALLGGIDPALH